MIDYFDLSLREASLYENYQSKGYSDLLISLKIADERIAQKILSTNGEWTKTRLKEVKRLVNDEINQAYGGLFAQTGKDSVAVAQIVADATLGTLATIPTATLNDLISSTRPIRMSEEAVYTFKELLGISQDNHARSLRTLISSGVAQGLTAEQIVREFKIKSTKLSKGQLRSNIFTIITNSRATGRYTAYKELEKAENHKGYIYSAKLDNRTSDYCSSHHNKRYYKPIEEISHLIHVHGNCRSQFIAISRLEINESEMQEYNEWYEKQSTEFKKSTLSKFSYEQYNKGNYLVNGLSDLNRSTSLATIKKLI